MFDALAQNYSSAVDPLTGQPYDATSGQFPWTFQGQTVAGDPDRDSGQAQSAFGHYDAPDYNDPAWLKSIGYTGPPPMGWQGSPDSGGMALDPAFTQWLQSQGITLGMSQMKGGGAGGQDQLRLQAFKNGQPVGTEHRWTKDENNPGFMAGMIGAGLFGGAAIAGLGAAGAGADAGGDLIGGEVGGYGAPDLAVPTNAATIDSSLGTPGYGASSAGAGGAEAAGGVTAGLPAEGYGAGVGGYVPPTNAANIESSLGTPGYGASSAGVGNPAGSIPGGSWYDMLSSGDIAGAVKAGGSDVLSFLKTPSGLNLLGGIANGLIGSNSASNALKAQQDAAAKALALQKYMYDTTRGDQAPYRATGEVGATGMRNLLADPSSIQNDPSYAWGLTQGQKSVDQSAASRGGLYSGATLKALERYGQDYGNTKLNDAYTRYGDAARLGEAATANVGAAGTHYADQGSAIDTGLGNAAGAASLYQGNTWMDGINNSLATLNRSTYGPAVVYPKP